MGAHDTQSWSHSLEAEQSLLGALMLDNEAYDKVADLVGADDFFTVHHRNMFRAIAWLIEGGRSADIVTVAERMEAENAQIFTDGGGAAYLAALATNTPSALNVRRYAEVVHERAVMRQLYQASMSITEAVMNFGGRAVEELLDQAQSKIMAIGTRRNDQVFRTLKDALAEAFEFVDQQHWRYKEHGDEISGTPYGFGALDHLTSGMHEGQLIVVGGRPSMGKSAFALNVTERAARATGKWGLFFTLEMGHREQALRMLSSTAKVNVQRLASGRVYDHEWSRVTGAIEKLHDLRIAFNEQASVRVNDIRSQARRAMREYGGLSLIVVDYLQLMVASDSENNRANEIAEISRGLKLLAKELRIPVMALSQLNRGLENRTNKRPVLSDLRESGAIEQDADVVMFIYRDEVYNQNSLDRGIAEVIVAKQRNGPIGTARLTFLGDRTSFENHISPEAAGER